MIVLNKKKKSWEMYPIGSPKGALNTKRTPNFIGVLKFSKDSDVMTINRFVVKDDKEDKLYPPSKAISFLKSQAVFLAQKDEDMEAFLAKNNIKVRFWECYRRFCSPVQFLRFPWIRFRFRYR